MCPRCGRGALFRSWYTLRPNCFDCGLSYERLARDTWALIYLSTAALTGVVVVGVVFLRPFDIYLGRIVLACIATALIVLTLPLRKGMAIAVNHYVESRLQAGPDRRA
jgi:uncharacterized protein (DUF983 family)